jgi:hypothetical protein
MAAALSAAADAVREIAMQESAVQAEKLRRVAQLGALAEAVGRAELGRRPRVSGQPADVQVAGRRAGGRAVIVSRFGTSGVPIPLTITAPTDGIG